MALKVTLLRHAAPEVRPGVRPERWSLSADGRQAARLLRGQLPERAVLASSGEAKAIETLCLATGRDRHRLHIDDNFGEVQRVEPFDDHHHSRRLAWVRNELDDRHIGWETPSQAAVRFQAGLDAIDDDVVVATHGMVMAAWLVARGIVEPGPSAGACWIRLTFPALVTAQRANQPD